VSGYDHESSITRRPLPTGGCGDVVRKKKESQRVVRGSDASDGQFVVADRNLQRMNVSQTKIALRTRSGRPVQSRRL
jgi:hypothetical protein